MNKSSINALLKEINNIVIQINNKKVSIKELEAINLEKSTLNYNKYISRISEIDAMEQSIKSLMENKYFRYIKHIDFIYDSDIKELNGFTLNKDLGCIIKKEESRQEIIYLNRTFNLNEKQITYTYDDTSNNIGNLLEYSFYNKSGLPLIPTSIKVYYKDNEDNFYEPHFRFYNRNNTTSFLNSFPFQPKQISKLIFDFDEEVNINNSKCNLYSITYSMLEENSILIEINNENGLNTFNISKKSEEATIPLLYYFSEDNIEFEPIEFGNNQDSIITLKNNSNFYIKIIADNNSIKIEEETAIKTTELYSSDLQSSFGTYTIPSNISSLSSIKITFPISTYKKIEERLKELKDINIDDFIKKDGDNLYVLNSEYIEYISSVDEKIKNLKYIDDISILETDKKYFTVYVDSKNNKVHFSSFMQEFNFFLEIQYPTLLEQIDSSYYTPYLFSISLKG